MGRSARPSSATAAVTNDARKVLALENDFESILDLADAMLIAYGFKSCGSN